MILKLETDSYALLCFSLYTFLRGVFTGVLCFCVEREVVGEERIFTEANVIYAIVEVLACSCCRRTVKFLCECTKVFMDLVVRLVPAQLRLITFGQRVATTADFGVPLRAVCL